MATLTEPSIGAPPPLKPGPPRGGGGDDHSGGPDNSRSGTTAKIAVYIGMVASTMTFTALVCAMFVRRGLATNNDWHRLAVPPLLWWNTAALVLSSVAIDIGRRAFRAGRRREFRVLAAHRHAARHVVSDQPGDQLEVSGGSRLLYVRTIRPAPFLRSDVGACSARGRSARGAVFRRVPHAVFPFHSAQPQRDGSECDILAHFLDVMWLILMAIFVFWA